MHQLLILCLPALLIGCGDKEDDSGHADAHQHGNTDLPDDFDPSVEHTGSNGITVSYVTDPTPIPESTEFAITFTLSTGTMTKADATMPSHGGHGMPVEPALTDNGDGTFTASPFEFSMPGYWRIHATVAGEDGQEERIDFDVDCCD
jgi:hypothetical protein